MLSAAATPESFSGVQLPKLPAQLVEVTKTSAPGATGGAGGAPTPFSTQRSRSTPPHSERAPPDQPSTALVSEPSHEARVSSHCRQSPSVEVRTPCSFVPVMYDWL